MKYSFVQLFSDANFLKGKFRKFVYNCSTHFVLFFDQSSKMIIKRENYINYTVILGYIIIRYKCIF